MNLATPYYLIDEAKLLVNLKRIDVLKRQAGVKSLLALKCFAAWAVFPLIARYMAGTTSSSIYEVRLGREKFGGETHAYCVAYSDREIAEVARLADKVIFNSASQLLRYHRQLTGLPLGIRINPGVSFSGFDLADPARRHSRLGVSNRDDLEKLLPLVSGAMFHFNCENADFDNFAASLGLIADRYGDILGRLDWLSLGGGIYFSRPEYPLERLAGLLHQFSHRFGLQLYLEPGESVVSHCGELVTTVLDIVENEKLIAIVDASTEAHMLDLLTSRQTAKIDRPPGPYRYIVAGRSCLAGDIFGEFSLDRPLAVGDQIRWQDAAGYTMVKRNWFNGLPAPAIVIRRLDGRTELQRRFDYEEFVNSLS
ncbi:MAG: carboxynorspermidine decarboxylase [Negativicutes bacterium]|nr:carboxynorspermidine decarboxylase [Negativicutes bacterium]